MEINGKHQLSVNDSNAGVTAALAGLGVLYTATFLIQDHISKGTLEPLFAGWCTEAKPMYVVYPPNRHLSNKVRVFVDWIAELFAKHDLIQRKSTLLETMCKGWGRRPSLQELVRLKKQPQQTFLKRLQIRNVASRKPGYPVNASVRSDSAVGRRSG